MDNGEVIYYSDAATKLKFIRKPIDKNGIHPDWDKYYVAEDNRADLFKSSKKGIYRLGYVDKNGTLTYFDFLSKYGLYQSSKYGIYRAVVYSEKIRNWVSMDLMPTQKLICFDLARAYKKVTNDRDKAIYQAALTSISIAIGGYSSTTFYGITQSHYNGYYAGYNWTGAGVHQHIGYAETYNYDYLARGAVQLLNSAFSANATVEKVRDAIEKNQCGFDL